MNSTLRIALVQMDIAWHQTIKNLDYITPLFKQHEADLWVLPEMFDTGFTMSPSYVAQPMTGSIVDWMKQQAQAHKIAIGGSVSISENNRFYNRFVIATPERILETYDKYHPYTPSGESSVYTRGNKIIAVEHKGWRIRLSICYDLRFPVFARNTDDYDVFLCVANWPKARIQAWNALLRARAIENMSYSIGVNRIGKDAYRLEYPGHSAVYDMLGNEICHMKKEPSVQVVQLDKAFLQKTRKKLPFLHDRDRFILE